MSIVGILVVGSRALGRVHLRAAALAAPAVLWSALAIVLSLALVRPVKGLMVALQYRHKAEEGRLER